MRGGGGVNHWGCYPQLVVLFQGRQISVRARDRTRYPSSYLAYAVSGGTKRLVPTKSPVRAQSREVQSQYCRQVAFPWVSPE